MSEQDHQSEPMPAERPQPRHSSITAEIQAIDDPDDPGAERRTTYGVDATFSAPGASGDKITIEISVDGGADRADRIMIDLLSMAKWYLMRPKDGNTEGHHYSFKPSLTREGACLYFRGGDPAWDVTSDSCGWGCTISAETYRLFGGLGDPKMSLPESVVSLRKLLLRTMLSGYQAGRTDALEFPEEVSFEPYLAVAKSRRRAPRDSAMESPGSDQQAVPPRDGAREPSPRIPSPLPESFFLSLSPLPFPGVEGRPAAPSSAPEDEQPHSSTSESSVRGVAAGTVGDGSRTSNGPAAGGDE